MDMALATSGGYGTWFDPAHRHHHLLDPATGRSAARHADSLGHGCTSHGGGRVVYGIDDPACGSGKTAASDIRPGYGLPLRTRRPAGDSRRMMVRFNRGPIDNSMLLEDTFLLPYAVGRRYP